ncbi:MAG: hypothetical protein ACK6AD_03495 [Cyanobacteriota bacterium]
MAPRAQVGRGALDEAAQGGLPSRPGRAGAPPRAGPCAPRGERRGDWGPGQAAAARRGAWLRLPEPEPKMALALALALAPAGGWPQGERLAEWALC